MASARRECKPPCIRYMLGSMSELAPLLSFATAGWNGPWPEAAAEALEQGAVVHFPKLVFELLPEERALVGRGLSVAGAKNISLDPASGRLGGIDAARAPIEALTRMMSRFRGLARALMLGIAPAYGASLETGRTSFRPVEIAGRPPSSWRADDTRLHTDAFPSTPTGGKRILRVFANVDPEGQPRLWRTGERFEHIAAAYLPRIRPPLPGSAALLRAVRLTRSLRSPYDHYMLRLHDMAKADARYQASSSRREISFGPSVWVVFTDQVPHAALGGRNALEQTFYLPVGAQRHPELAPLKVLERLTGRRLAA
jgi:3-deoxy-D-manno-oct-2-ulosonic acid (Kdo) hydroxylase